MKLIVLLGVSILGFGCAVKTPELMLVDVDQSIPGQWAATKPARSGVDVDWVERFDDQELSKIVAEALSSNYEMSIAAERVVRAQEAARVEGALTKPQVTLSSTADRRKSNGRPRSA